MKKIIKIYVRFVQRILITILLTILYFTVLSITKLFVIILPNKHLRRSSNADTFWIPAEGYSTDMDSSLEQS
jgi:hypothetical protein